MHRKISKSYVNNVHFTRRVCVLYLHYSSFSMLKREQMAHFIKNSGLNWLSHNITTAAIYVCLSFCGPIFLMSIPQQYLVDLFDLLPIGTACIHRLQSIKRHVHIYASQSLDAMIRNCRTMTTKTIKQMHMCTLYFS